MRLCLLAAALRFTSLLPSAAAQFERIDGGAGTGCGRGADYSFFFRPGAANKVVVDFEGGEPRPSDPRTRSESVRCGCAAGLLG